MCLSRPFLDMNDFEHLLHCCLSGGKLAAICCSLVRESVVVVGEGHVGGATVQEKWGLLSVSVPSKRVLIPVSLKQRKNHSF